MDVDLPSRRFKGLPREQRVIHLGLLKAEQIGLDLLQPGEHLIESCPNRVHVPAGDLHGSVASAGDP